MRRQTDISLDDITQDTKIEINHVARDDISAVNIVRVIDGKKRYTQIGSIYSKTKKEYRETDKAPSRLAGAEGDTPAVTRVKHQLSYFYSEVLFKEYRFFASAGLPANVIYRLNDKEREKITAEIDRLDKQHLETLSALLRDGFEVRQKHSDGKHWIKGLTITARVKELERKKTV